MELGNREAHMGHFFLECMKRRPDAICHIDAATGEQETNASVLHRSVRLAQSLRRLGLVPGDVLALGGRNHIDLHIPHYAAILNGLPLAGVDPLFKLDEIRTLFKLTSPKVAFCDPEHYAFYVQAAKDLGLLTRVFSFGTGEHSMEELIRGCDDDTPIEGFKPATIDQDKIYAWLVSSGGTTGVIKVAAIKHTTWRQKLEFYAKLFPKKIERIASAPNKPALNLSPVQWISGFFNALSMPLGHHTIIQTSAPATTDHIIDIINKYRPESAMMGPSLATDILGSSKECDLTCFNVIIFTGGKVYLDILHAIKKRVRQDSLVLEAYGQTENLGAVFKPAFLGPVGSCGRPLPENNAKLVDPDTGIEITEANVPGELWTLRTLCFSEYYNNPEETSRAFTEDGWYKTGDMLYRNEDGYYFFVERLSMLIKYRNYHVIPPELEEVIRSHPGVQEVSVTSIPHSEDGEHPVACVVRRPGVALSASEIKDLVADKLSESKHLRGGVIFMDAIPMTSSGKVARAKLRQIASKAYRE